jgi:hypothetical protein
LQLDALVARFAPLPTDPPPVPMFEASSIPAGFSAPQATSAAASEATSVDRVTNARHEFVCIG